jgi:Na+/H+ antiporter NhaD/arsenite permease-like protein
MPRSLPLLVGVIAAMLPGDAFAAGLPGGELALWWAAPFAGLLLSLALLPLLTPRLWHHYDNYIIAAWAALVAVPLYLVFGAGLATVELVHAMIVDFIPFICLLTALYTITGGIRLTGRLGGTPMANAGILAVGTLLAGWIGTTGASMLMIRPLIIANKGRRNQAHVVVFFIFLVSNVGGALTPLGDPPLFLGFLRGVDFFWPLIHLAAPTAIITAVVLATFLVVDTMLWRRDPASAAPAADAGAFRMEGMVNLVLMGLVILAVMLSGTLKLGHVIDSHGIEITVEGVVRDIAMVALILASLALTPKEIRERNYFTWAPMIEVAKVFACIFICIVPPLAMLKAGANGPFSGLMAYLTQDGQPVDKMYFLLTGVLSSFLDNAPTYLVFFNAAGGDPQALMGPLASTLAAISAGAVFMGAMTYIGNAPNFMVRSIAEAQGVRMPSFFGYMVWSIGILAPSFIIVALLFF